MFNFAKSGYTEGGMDVESTVNLFFKGILLFPIFLFALYVGATMMKHMIFHGIPHMTTPSAEQVEAIRNRDREINPNENTRITAEQVREQTEPLGITPDLLRKDPGTPAGLSAPKDVYRWVNHNCDFKHVEGYPGRDAVYVCNL